MQALSAILDKVTSLKSRNSARISPLLSIPPADLMPYDVSKSGLTRSDVHDKIKKIHSCAGLLEFRTIYKPDSAGTIEQGFKLHNATFCQQYTVCEICSKRVQQTRWKRFEKPIDRMIDIFPYVYHTTFTVTDRPNLGERLDFLQAAFRSFVRRGQRRKKGSSLGEWSKVGAAIVATECKRGESKLVDGEWVGGSDLWHAHRHALLFCKKKLDYRVYDQTEVRKLEKKYGFREIPKARMIEAAVNLVSWIDPATGKEKKIPVSKMSAEWFSSTGGQGISVKVQLLSRSKIKDQVREILKYPVKTSLKTNLDIPYIIEQTYNRRFLSTYGELRGLSTDEYTDSETADSKEIYLSQWTDGKYSDLVPGSPIVFLPDEVKKKRQIAMAKLTGLYRRQRAAFRRAYSFVKVKILGDLSADLDRAKVEYRSAMSKIVSHFGNMPSLPARIMPRWSRSALPDAEQLVLSL